MIPPEIHLNIYLQVGSPVTVTNTVVQPQTLEAGSAQVPHVVELLGVLVLAGSSHEPHVV